MFDYCYRNVQVHTFDMEIPRGTTAIDLVNFDTFKMQIDTLNKVSLNRLWTNRLIDFL